MKKTESFGCIRYILIKLVMFLGGDVIDEKASPQYGSLESTKRQFTYSEIRMMTNNFERVLGKGGFGPVYHGYMEHTQVAIKMLSASSIQGFQQFRAEAIIVDPRLDGNFNTNSVWKAVEIAMACVSINAIKRPSMSQVVVDLKECLATECARTNHSRVTEFNNSNEFVADNSIEVQKLVREVAEIVVLVIDEEDVESLISELVIAVNDSQADGFAAIERVAMDARPCMANQVHHLRLAVDGEAGLLRGNDQLPTLGLEALATALAAA
ncbi:hypothetical protein ACE6H2_009956 [Prunus campanulata]